MATGKARGGAGSGGLEESKSGRQGSGELSPFPYPSPPPSSLKHSGTLSFKRSISAMIELPLETILSRVPPHRLSWASRSPILSYLPNGGVQMVLCCERAGGRGFGGPKRSDLLLSMHFVGIYFWKVHVCNEAETIKKIWSRTFSYRPFTESPQNAVPTLETT